MARMAPKKSYLSAKPPLTASEASTSALFLGGRFRRADGSFFYRRMENVSKLYVPLHSSYLNESFLSGSVQPVICDLKVNEYVCIEAASSLGITDVYHNKVLGVRTAPNTPPTIKKCHLNTVDDIELAQRVPFKKPAKTVRADG